MAPGEERSEPCTVLPRISLEDDRLSLTELDWNNLSPSITQNLLLLNKWLQREEYDQ